MAKNKEYVVLPELEVLAAKGMSILVQHPSENRVLWIGRSCLHFLTDERIDEYDKKRVPFPVMMMNFRVFKWLAEKERLIQANPEPKDGGEDESDETMLPGVR